tara:strand:+ start:5454 stop:5924 length:471 start_codon:yes stop_codon:yes gene_type:complete
MAYQKLQGKRAIAVTPTDGVQVPSPSDLSASGSNTSIVANQLEDNTAAFIGKVIPGSTIVNETTGAWATVTGVQSQTELLLSANIFLATPETYAVYSVDVNEGPVLYVGTGGGLTITTVGNDVVELVNVADASFIPIMVRTVQSTGTTASDILAIW